MARNDSAPWFRFGLSFALIAIALPVQAALAQDVDGDGILDISDNCPGVYNPLQANGDLDTAGNVCDCNPDEGGSPVLLGPTTDLVFSTKTSLDWVAPGDTGGGSLSFDLLRSPVSSNFEIATCVESNELNTTASDGGTPAAGGVFYYVLRADGSCGGNLGGDESEARRAGSTCPVANAVPTCTEVMDSTCPNSSPSCTGVSFTGGVGCLIEFIGNCYDTGTRSYKVTQAAPLTIDFTGNVFSLDLFFAAEVAGTTGAMRFFDVDNLEVDSALATNGVCGGAVMPPKQNLSFSRAVRRMEVSVNGPGDVWVDTLTVNPNVLATCTETMDAACPNGIPSCSGVSFTGGLGCFFEFLGNCYSTGTKSYKVVAAAPLEIDFAADVNTLEVFFANEVAGVSGTMRFFDIDGFEVDSPITTNGVCGGAVMPPTQMLAFSRPVRKIEVVATGIGDVWIDTLTVNP
jgi:hypothetical protein